MNRWLAVTLTTFAIAALAPSAHADAYQFADAIYDYTHDRSRASVVTRLMKFEIGKKCWARIVEKDGAAVGAAAYATRDIVTYATQVTGTDWSSINDAQALASAMDAFKAKLFITIKIDGDDCAGDELGVWLRYWKNIASALEDHQPPSGKAMITLDVSSKVKDFTVAVSGDGTVFTIRAPKAQEPDGWEDKLEKALEQQIMNVADDFAFEVERAIREGHAAQVITKLHTFKVGKRCRAKFTDRDGEVIYVATFVVTDISDWAAKYHADEWKQFASKTDLEPFAKRLSVTVIVDGDDCDVTNASPWLTYWQEALDALKRFPPRANNVTIKITASAKARDVSVSSDKTGSTFTITGPTARLPKDAKDRIQAAFMKVTRDKEAVAIHARLEATSRAVKAGKNPWPHHGRPMRDHEIRDIPSYDHDREYTKGAVVREGMSSNPHTLVYKCKETTCTDSPGVSSQWQSVGWANAD